MKKRALFLCMVVLVFFFGLSVPSFSQSAGQDNKERIVDVQIKGNVSISTASIINRLKIKPGDVYEEIAINKEIKRMYAIGYFSDISVETVREAGGVIVIFTVVEKPVISEIKFVGNTKISRDKLLKKMSVKEGDLLDNNILSQDVAAIKNNYIERGFSNVSVEYKSEQIPDTGKTTVTFIVDEGESIRIKTIKIEGNKHIKTEDINNVMATKTAWWFIRKGAFDQEKFDDDLNRIKNLFRSKGFLDVEVTSKIDYSPDGKYMYITVIIDEKKQYTLGEISLAGQFSFPEDEIRKLVKIKSGKAFDYGNIKDAVENIRSFYYDRGYMNAEVDVEHKYNATTDKMDIVINIQAHEEVYVGKINVIGNVKTKDKVIRREVRVYPGDKYDGKKLKRSKERLYNLGYFEDVYLDTVGTDEAGVKDLNITVKETKTGELSFGGGYSSVDSLIGFVQISQKNFDILNFPTFMGGGQRLVIRAEGGSARTNYLLSWTDPWIFDYPFSFGFDVYRDQHNKYGSSGYDFDEIRTGGSLKLGKELTDYLNTGLIYNLEQIEISDIPDTASQDLKDEDGKNFISRLTWNTEFDTRDNKFSPSKGLISGISLENAGGFIGGDKDFMKGYLYTNFYHSIIPDVVLELKGSGGVVESYGDSKKVPIYERFFAGGANSIRGYEERSVGPRDEGDKSLVIGGEAMVLGGAEVTFPLYKKIIKGAVFYDIGSVMANSKDVFDTGDYKMGTGVGIHVKTPIGPVRLDYGIPLVKNEGDKKEGQFYFSASHGF